MLWRISVPPLDDQKRRTDNLRCSRLQRRVASGMARMLSTTLDRRSLLRHCAALAGALPLLASPAGFASAQSALPARRVFFENPDYVNVRLSPDGAYLAYVAPVDRVRNLWIAPVASPERGKPLTRVRDRNISIDIHW